MENRQNYNFSSEINIARQRTICVATDWLTSFVAFFCFNIFRYYYMGLEDKYETLSVYIFSAKLIFEQIAVPIFLLFIYWLSGYYNHPYERSRLHEFLITVYSQLFNAVIIYLAALTNDHLLLRRENWMLLLILFALLFTFTYVGRILVTARMIKRLSKNGIKPHTIIIGISEEAVKVADKLRNPLIKPNAEIIGFLPFDNEKDWDKVNAHYPDTEKFDSVEELLKSWDRLKIDQVIIVPPEGNTHTNHILHLLYLLYPYEISIKIKPGIFSLITPSVRLGDIMGEPFIDLASPQISEFAKNVKRAIDVTASTLGLIVTSPLLGFLALMVKRSSPGKVIYSQDRIGLHRKPFRIYKFRSMVTTAEEDGVPRLSGDNDSRITSIGKWMRKYRLDELPQLWNVLRGDMSLVGPRPEREYYIEKIVKKAPWYTLVHQVKPGITSWGMVKYGYATDVDQMIERNRFDLIYLANMSVVVDIKILIHTVKTVGAGEGK